ncbi:hypothetical protein [Reyranella sp.]|uniref:hypothetical protein n=1 Tax=Reyranella sp. TaxID=1929291 RepID=UPI003BACAF57
MGRNAEDLLGKLTLGASQISELTAQLKQLLPGSPEHATKIVELIAVQAEAALVADKIWQTAFSMLAQEMWELSDRIEELEGRLTDEERD